jgi:hypothetical protein
LRTPESPEEKAVALSGWRVTTFLNNEDGVTVVLGAAAVDGMCRPNQFQHFIFVNGTFAGTLSPRLMDSRSDGSLRELSFPGHDRIAAGFSRYADQDPLCCPSRTSEGMYEIQTVAGKPVVVLTRLKTRQD